MCICDTGYSWNGDKCIPICPKGCRNGECTKPDVCTCNPGYETSTVSECKPVCEKRCISGQCTAPNVCTCAKGYESNSFDQICNAMCNPVCINSTCIAPNTCKCNAGYLNTNNSTSECSPQCETPCLNGECIAPNTCRNIPTMSSLHPTTNTNSIFSTLNEFEQDATTLLWSIMDESNTTKEPSFCDEKYSMPRTCTGDTDCDCIIGYTPCNSTHCLPKCSLECVNSECAEPDVCSCREGYSEGYNETEWNVCYPQCGDSDSSNNGCLNGHCTEPNHCECFAGFEKRSDDTFKCVPCTGGHCQDRSDEWVVCAQRFLRNFSIGCNFRKRVGEETTTSSIMLIITCVFGGVSVVSAISFFVYRRRRTTSEFSKLFRFCYHDLTVLHIFLGYPIDPIYVSSSND